VPVHSPRTPVLIGIGTATQRFDDPLQAAEPIALMIGAAEAAGRDCGSPAALSGVEQISVPRGRWRYGDPGREIARRLCAGSPTTVLAHVGVLQQSLIADACVRIADGAIDLALVVGGEAGYRLRRARGLGVASPDAPLPGKPDITLTAQDELLHPAELRAGLKSPVSLYAILESAFRARNGVSIADHDREMAQLYSRLSAIAADNPLAWSRKVLAADDILADSPRNPVQALPYRRLHCASWNVDQAAALLFCSGEKARALGLDDRNWIYPWASTESQHMQPLMARDDLAASPGARLAGEAALAAGGLTLDDIALLELYSCFPVAIEMFARELGASITRDLTVTGGMPFAGGPFNNYVLQATCRMAEMLRRRPGAKGLVSSVSGILTKQAFGLWSSAPPPAGFCFADVTADVARIAPAREVLDQYRGAASVAGYTVLHEGDAPPRGIVVADTDDGRRTIASNDDPQVVGLLSETEGCGKRIHVDGTRFTLAA
jgi:acetyl-CoA C-acetyltransferase